MTARRQRHAITLVELLVTIAIIGVLVGLLVPAVQQARNTAARIKCQNNLKQIGLALHMYHDAYRSLPPGVSTKKSGTPYLSLGWQPRLLPFIEQDGLWGLTVQAFQKDRFPFNNPPHVGLNTVVGLLVCPADGRVLTSRTSHGYHVAFTSYLGVEGIDLHTTDGVLYADSRVRLTNITDGTSNTLMAGERPPSADLYYGWWYAGAGQGGSGSCDMVLGVRERNIRGIHFWGCRPGPFHFAPGKLDNQCDQFHFWSLHPGGGNFLMADGSVHFLAYSADRVMPALATRAGGEVAGVP